MRHNTVTEREDIIVLPPDFLAGRAPEGPHRLGIGQSTAPGLSGWFAYLVEEGIWVSVAYEETRDLAVAALLREAAWQNAGCPVPAGHITG